MIAIDNTSTDSPHSVAKKIKKKGVQERSPTTKKLAKTNKRSTIIYVQSVPKFINPYKVLVFSTEFPVAFIGGEISQDYSNLNQYKKYNQIDIRHIGNVQQVIAKPVPIASDKDLNLEYTMNAVRSYGNCDFFALLELFQQSIRDTKKSIQEVKSLQKSRDPIIKTNYKQSIENSFKKQKEFLSQYPCLTFTWEFTDGDDVGHLGPASYNSLLLETLGYTIENFSEQLYVDGIPEMFTPDNKRLIAKLTEGTLSQGGHQNIFIGDNAISEFRADIFTREGYTKNGLFEFYQFIEPTKGITLYHTILVCKEINYATYIPQKKFKPLNPEYLDKINERYSNLKSFTELTDEKIDISDRLYNKEKKVCQIREISQPEEMIQESPIQMLQSTNNSICHDNSYIPEIQLKTPHSMNRNLWKNENNYGLPNY